MMITDQGTLARIRIKEISVISRNTKGVKLINLSNDETLVGIQRVEEVIAEVIDEASDIGIDELE